MNARSKVSRVEGWLPHLSGVAIRRGTFRGEYTDSGIGGRPRAGHISQGKMLGSASRQLPNTATDLG